MSNFITSEQCERHAFLDATVRNASETLRCPETVAVLGAQATEFANILDERAFFPNMRHGKIALTRQEAAGEGLPFIAAQPGTRVTIDRAIYRPTPLQATITRKVLGEMLECEPAEAPRLRVSNKFEKLRDYKARFNRNAYALTLETQSLASAKAHGRKWHGWQLGRPFVLLEMGGIIGNERMTPSIVVHELQHYVQAMAEPIFAELSVERTYGHELEAYDVQAGFEQALAEGGYQPVTGEYLNATFKTTDGRATVTSPVQDIKTVLDTIPSPTANRYEPSPERVAAIADGLGLRLSAFL